MTFNIVNNKKILNYTALTGVIHLITTVINPDKLSQHGTF